MVDIAKLAIEVDSTQAVKAADNLDKLSSSTEKVTTKAKFYKDELGRVHAESGKFAKAIDYAGQEILEYEDAVKIGIAGNKRLNDSFGRAGVGFANFGRSAGAAGIQIQQFVGQVQGGVNPMVALSQQAADLGIVLGAPLVGAVVGITAAIAGPFIASLFNASKETDKFNEKIQQTIDGLESTRVEILSGAIEQLKLRINEANSEIERLQQAPIKPKFDSSSANSFLMGQSQILASNASLVDSEKQIAEINKAKQKDIEALAELQNELNEETIKNAESVDKFIESLKNQAGAAGLSGAELIEYQKSQDLARLADMGATDEKLTLVSGYYDQLIAVERNRQANTDYAKSMREAQAAQAAFYQSLSTDIAFTMSPEQQAAQQLGEQMQKYEELRQNDKISHEQYLAGKEAAEAAYAKRVSDINAQQAALERQQQMDRLGYAADFFGNLSSISQAAGKDSFESYKLFASAQAAVQSALAILNVLADPKIPYPLNIALAGTMGALTAVQIAQIQGAEYQSYEGGGFTGTGPRTGGVDGKGGMMAIVHPNETITDHTKPGSPAPSSGTTVNVIEDASRAGTQEMSRGPSNEEILNVFVDSIRKGGRAYKAVQGMRGGR